MKMIIRRQIRARRQPKMKKMFSLPSLRHFVLALTVVGVAPTSRLVAAPDAPITPKETIVLFDGKTKKDLSAFYTWLPAFGRQDPDKVFTVVEQIDGAPAIRVSGQHWGGFVTRGNYTNYKLVVEFRWGNLTWGKRANRTRDSGILLHGQGEDGNATKDFMSPWFRSVEYQIIEGGTGDIILVQGFDRGSDQKISPKLTATVAVNGKNWDPKGTPK
ncbi:MAG: family 16 glycoside hydrolase, partial [Opitutaceae bacterium]